MIIDLKPDMEAWLKSQVEKGHFSSVDEVLSTAINLMREVENSNRDEDDNWAKPYIAEALNEVERGDLREWTKGDALARIQSKYADILDDNNT